MDSIVILLNQLMDMLEKAGLINVGWIKYELQKLCYRFSEHEYQRFLNRLYTNYPELLLTGPFRIPISEEDRKTIGGLYKVGLLAGTDIDFGLHALQLQMHGVVGGGTGFGKSTFIKVLAQQIMAEGKTKIWFIDPKEGGDYRPLARRFMNMLVLRPDVIRLNPFNMIKNVPVEVLRESVSEVTADSFGVYDASESVITEHVRRIFEENVQPNFYDFIRSVWSEKVRYGGRRPGYLDTIKSRLIKIDASMGNIVNCKSDNFSEFYGRDMVFEVGSLSGNSQRILVPWIIHKLVLYKIRNPTPHLSHLLVFDEAQSQIFSRHLEMRGRTSFMATLATQARAFGLGIVVLAQNPGTKLMTEIIANSCYKVCFALGSGDEVIAMSRHMGLDREQMDVLHHLKPGEAICRSGLFYTDPVRLDVFNFQDQKMSDNELVDMMKPKWDELLEGIEPAIQEDKQLFLPAVRRSRTDSKPEKSTGESLASVPGKTVSTSSGELSANEGSYLRIVFSHIYLLVTEIYRILGDKAVMGTETISQATAVKARKKLLAKGYLESFTVVGTGKSGKSLCDVTTGKGGFSKVKKPRGDHLHGWWCYRLAAFFRKKGAEVKIGDTLSGNECDLSILLDGKKIGGEVVISGLVVDNLTKYLSTGYFDEMLVLCIDPKKQKEMVKQIEKLGEEIKAQIKVQLLKGYFISI